MNWAKKLSNLRLRLSSELLIWGFVLLPLVFMMINLKCLDDVFTMSPAYGSDMGSHYYNAWYLTKKLLPNFTIFGWDQGSFAGYPALQFYHPLPFLLSALLSLVIPFPIAFKLIVLLSVLLLPLAAYSTLRLFGLPAAAAALGSIFTLLTLYHFDHQIYGGNLASIFCGEFCFALANGLLLILMGTLYRGLKENRLRLLNIVLLSSLALTHLMPFAVALTFGAYFFICNPNKKNFRYLFVYYSQSFLLTAFFTLPLVAKQAYTASLIDNVLTWFDLMDLQMLFPSLLIPCYALILIYCLKTLFSGSESSEAFYFCLYCMVCAAAFYIHNILGWPSRYVPIVGIMATVTAALAFAELVRYKNLPLHLFYLSVLIIVLIVNGKGYKSLVGYSAHSFSGSTRSKGYQDFLRLNSYLAKKGNQERLVGERGKRRASILVSLAFNYVPYLSGVNTLEGLYGAGAFGRLFEQSIGGSLNDPKAISDTLYEQLLEYNVGWMVGVSSDFKSALDKDSRFSRSADFGELRLYHINENSKSHVQVLPALSRLDVDFSDWKKRSQEQFRRWNRNTLRFAYDPDNKLSLPVITTVPPVKKEDQPLSAPQNCITSQTLADQSFEFTTSCPGQPHMIKISYFPDWQVEGAQDIYLVNPGFMLVYPEGQRVRLYYGRTGINIVGNILSLVGLVLLLVQLLPAFNRNIPSLTGAPILIKPGITRKLLMILAIIYIGYGIPNGYYKFSGYLTDYRILRQLPALAAAGNYKEIENLADRIKFRSNKQDKNYWLAKSYYFLKKHDSIRNPLYSFVNNKGDKSLMSELRYYNLLSKFEQKLYDETMHEYFVINREHKGLPWAEKARQFMEDWEKKEPQLYEQHRKFYK